MPHIFLDESGQFSKHNGEKFFVIGSFTVGNVRRTEKQFRSWQRTKFPRRIRFQPEIKFSDVNIDEKLKLKTLEFIVKLDVRIHFSYLLKNNISADYRLEKNKLKSGYLYTNVVSETLEMYLPVNDLEFRVFCDKRHLRGVRQPEYKAMLKARLLPRLPQGAIIQIETIDSKKNANIQIADWVSGALACYLENKPIGEACYRILKNNLLGEGKELFANYWEEKFSKQKPQQNS